MIAIAGAKGGCGKTTTALGLAAAFTRAGTESLVIDADCQLPDLHVTAGVCREPTVAALDRETNWRTVAQKVPGTPGVYVLPGPTATETVDIGSTLKWLDTDQTQVLVDCPSGAGPDVIEPTAAADSVIVVSTGSDQGLDAAVTTIEIADRLEIPVEGVLLTHCVRHRDGLEERFGAPVLGAIPEYESPLSTDRAHVVYDEVVGTLLPDNVPGERDEFEGTETENGDRPEPRSGSRVIANGPESSAESVADSAGEHSGGAHLGQFDGSLWALPPGTVAVLESDPASQAEHLLYGLTAARGTLYITTERSEAAVRHAMETTPVRVGSPTVRHLSQGEVVDDAERLVGDLPDSSSTIIDPMYAFEQVDHDRYVGFLNTLKERMVETEGIAVLHCLSRRETPENRASTNYAADAVFDHSVTPATSTNVAVTKWRHDGAALEGVDAIFESLPASPGYADD